MLHSNTIHSIEDRAFKDLKSLQVKCVCQSLVEITDQSCNNGIQTS